MRLKCFLSVYTFIVFWGTIVVLTLPSLLIYFLVYPFVKYPQDIFQNLAAVIYKIFFTLLPIVKLEFHNINNLPEGAIYVSTHQSSLDYPILGYFIRKYLTVTNLNFTVIPFASFVGELIGARSLKKNNLGEIAKMYSEFEGLLNHNRNIIIFPEGTRSDGTKLGKFKKGAFRLAIKTGKPIIPIIIDGSAKIVAKGDPCFKTTSHTTVKVTMLDMVDPKDFDDEIELLNHVHSLMEYKN
ncbi:1-acyl-sn-glycerol-3-phosphate acyltransferase [Sulfurimonas sp.]|nr:1-acyl-sn-glycerol-3-phosphate acyltransferase [Sulfurimonas sp.]